MQVQHGLTGESVNGGEFDYVIVGAGSAGCVLAARLSEDPAARVLLLEAGGADRDPLIHIPIGIGKILPERRHDWGYNTEPESSLDGRALELPRGRVLCGCSSINALLYVRGDRRDYDRWAREGASGWSYAQVLPYFKRTETWQGGANPWRGGSGPIKTRFTDLTDPMGEAVLGAAGSAGFAVVEDYNGEVQEGFGMAQSTIDGGRRSSAARAYLHPAMRRANLEVRTHALATRVLLEGNRALGVEYLRQGQLEQARAVREVLLCGGAINSPQLLLLSGIGDGAKLRSHGIGALVHSPGVGANLQDHPVVRVGCRRRQAGPLQRALRVDRIAFAMLRAYLAGTGPATRPPAPVMGMVRSSPDAEAPDIQLCFRGIALDARPWWPIIGPRFADAFFLLAVLLHPKSRGSVELASNNPRDPARIRVNFLADGDDAATLAEGVRMARRVISQPALEPFRGEELLPGAMVQSEAELDRFLRATASTLHHACGTCRMGANEQAVVDCELRVRGCERLRVVDASVMPDLVSGNINACVLMIAERAADLIRGIAPLPAALLTA